MWIVKLGWIPLLLFSIGYAQQRGTQEVSVSTYYVWAGAAEGGEGTQARPFASLAGAAAASGPGDIIYLMTKGAGELLDGGIALKPGQKLIGLGPEGQTTSATSPTVRITNRTENLDGVIVKLSERNEVAGIHFVDMQNHAIYGSGSDYSGATIHHNRFTGAAESEGLIWAVFLEARSGSISGVTVSDIVVRDGEDLGGIQVLHTGSSRGEYQFERNDFSDIGGRAYHIWSQGTSKVVVNILDSTADNIGVGGRNSDSILPHLWGSSEQIILVRNYQYHNSKQVGSRSNTGLEAFIMGEPFSNEEQWCDGCKLTLEIVDSLFEDSVTDGIQLTNYGSNSVLDFKIRNTKIIGAKPQQAGGAISLIAQNAQNSGSRSTLLVENCDIINSSRYGFVISDRGDGYTSIVDLGGGALGSAGNNRIINSAAGEIQVLNANPVARHNWWGSDSPRIELQGDSSSIELDPVLTSDPRNR